MLPSTLLRPFLLASAALLVVRPALAAPVAGCCTAGIEVPASPSLAPAFMFLAPAPLGPLPKPLADRGQFNRSLPHHFWLMGGLHTVPTGFLLTPETSSADRTTFSQAGVGVGYMVSPALRAISSWNTGLNANSVSRGNQFAVGVAWRY